MAFINRDPSRTIAPSHLKVLFCIIQMSQKVKPITIRGVCRRLGFSSPNAPKDALVALKRHGLIDWVQSKGKASSKKCATIHPTCYLKMVPVADRGTIEST